MDGIWDGIWDAEGLKEIDGIWEGFKEIDGAMLSQERSPVLSASHSLSIVSMRNFVFENSRVELVEAVAAKLSTQHLA